MDSAFFLLLNMQGRDSPLIVVMWFIARWELLVRVWAANVTFLQGPQIVFHNPQKTCDTRTLPLISYGHTCCTDCACTDLSSGAVCLGKSAETLINNLIALCSITCSLLLLPSPTPPQPCHHRLSACADNGTHRQENSLLLLWILYAPIVWIDDGTLDKRRRGLCIDFFAEF